MVNQLAEYLLFMVLIIKNNANFYSLIDHLVVLEILLIIIF